MEKASSMFASIFSSGGSSEPAAATVSSIFIYPVKSCRGISVPQACITSTGFRWDRQWLVVNSKGRAYTQRVEPKLALVEVVLPADAFIEDWEPSDSSYLVGWWMRFGTDAPSLRKFAIRVLCLTCSASGCERNWSTFEQVHTKRRNRLEHKRMNSLVYVMYNLKLRERTMRRRQMQKDPVFVEEVGSDDEWITEQEDPCLPSDHSWLEQPIDGEIQDDQGDHLNYAAVDFIPETMVESVTELRPSKRRRTNIITAPGMDTLKIPLRRTCTVIDGISVWEWSGSAFDEGAEASEWFTSYLGKPSRLVRFNISSETRAVDPSYAQGYKTMFSDEYPFLLISQGSLDALNKFLNEPLPINRFRPNILVDGCEPFSEDLWKVMKISKLTFHGVKLCSRCKVPTINQENGIAGVEPTETLMKFRSDHALDLNRKQQGKVYFGQNLVCKESLSTSKGKVVRVGDPIYILQKVPSCADAPA